MNKVKIDNIQQENVQSCAIAVIGLGYVGYPLL